MTAPTPPSATGEARDDPNSVRSRALASVERAIGLGQDPVAALLFAYEQVEVARDRWEDAFGRMRDLAMATERVNEYTPDRIGKLIVHEATGLCAIVSPLALRDPHYGKELAARAEEYLAHQVRLSRAKDAEIARLTALASSRTAARAEAIRECIKALETAPMVWSPTAHGSRKEAIEALESLLAEPARAKGEGE